MATQRKKTIANMSEAERQAEIGRLLAEIGAGIAKILRRHLRRLQDAERRRREGDE